MLPGTATRAQIEATSAGKHGWINYKPSAHHRKPKQKAEREILSFMCQSIPQDEILSAATQATKDKYKNRARTEEEKMENQIGEGYTHA